MDRGLFDLSGKVALVTGASSGLGVQFTKTLARQGADVAIAARRADRLEELKLEIVALGVRCLALPCDVVQLSQVSKMVEDVCSHFGGRIDILVNNAGIANSGNSEDVSDESFAWVQETNVNAVFRVAREVGKVMIKQSYGRIINTASICAQVASNDLAAYSTSKAAVWMLTKCLAVDWAKYGITVNAIGPGAFPTEMTQDFIHDPEYLKQLPMFCPMGRPGRDGELDGALIYFASDSSSYTTGQMLVVDGGLTLTG